ncbi:hypothetical protein OCA8868_00046 [Octadecabacter ascidiaceicola]|uniref:Uncharacterized protein n=1 Tax=Octadecabacter ascidiaceicola TaxID=1655543 RepID=A0A238JKV2_9RHOB|nr:hypothetical protein OCA8868_00046 [Octadecabacter ascidiaceicola]
MQRTLKQTWLWSAVLALSATVFMAHPAFAEMIWYQGQWVDSRYLTSWQIEDARQARTVLGVLRIGMMLLATTAGFAIGWFFSPEAKALREWIALGLFFVLALVAIFNPSLTGWGFAILVALLGFAWGLGYWLGRGVQALFETPTTFGSSRWATQKDMEKPVSMAMTESFLVRP